MTNPTTPFSWQMPTSTDLVTDLPADFETFGQAVATSMADLLGGTSGQILSKASNTDMDFTWITNDVGDITAVTAGTGISGGGTSGAVTVTNSMATTMTTKGDLVPATGSGTFARLAVGNNGETLVADSSTSSGLRWQAPVQQNPVLNSAFQVWQRGTSISLAASSNSYTADRWLTPTGTNQACTVSRQATGDTTNLPNIQYAMRFQRNSGQTGVGSTYQMQSFESINSVPFAGKTVTVSFYARKGANYSQASSALLFYLDSGTGTDQNVSSGFTGQATVASVTATLTTTWQRFTATGTVSSSASQLAVYTVFTPVGTAGAADYFEITGVQLEVGSVATPFHTYAATIQGELAACQRYYYRTGPGISGEIFAFGNAYSTTRLLGPAPVPVTMRVTPSAIEFSSLELNDFNGGFAVTALTIYSGGKNMPTIDARVASGLTANRFFNLMATGTSGYLAFSAEL